MVHKYRPHLVNAARIVPPLYPEFHKGQHGRVLVIGGSEDYSGAPFYAAMASARTGADMCHVLCTEQAAPTIKTYSPGVMVHGYLTEGAAHSVPQKAIDLLARVHVVLVGSGLGRDPHLLEQVSSLIESAKSRELPLIVDADGLYLATQRPDLIENSGAILTPNPNELKRLVELFEKRTKLTSDDPVKAIQQASANLGFRVLIKQDRDVVVAGDHIERSSSDSSPRRTSGQGDVLAGCLATFVAWTVAYKQKLWNTYPVLTETGKAQGISEEDALVLAAGVGASETVRAAALLAYSDRGRSVIATDVLDHLGKGFEAKFGTPITSKEDYDREHS